jgi:hypothetical protein
MTANDTLGQSSGSSLLHAVHNVLANELPYMALNASQLPAELAGFELLRESELDNETMAKHGFVQKTPEELAKLGRISGYLREFVVHQGAATLQDEPADIVMAATVVHLFETGDAVKRWIDESFVCDFRDNVGKESNEGQILQGVEILEIEGLHDYAAGLFVIHEMPDAILASTIIDFRMGNLLGVAYVVAKRDITLSALAKELALALEKQMVRVALGGS